jgi:hypothetical protein
MFRTAVKNVALFRSSRKVHDIFSDFNQIWGFSTFFRVMGAALIHAD